MTSVNIRTSGDIATYPQQNGDEARIEHWNVRLGPIIH